MNLSKTSPLATRGWRAPGECRAVTPRNWGRSPSARRGDFIPSPGELFTPKVDGAQALRASRSQNRRSRQERPEGERSEASPERGHRSAPPTTFRSTRDPFAGADERILSWFSETGINTPSIPVCVADLRLQVARASVASRAGSARRRPARRRRRPASRPACRRARRSRWRSARPSRRRWPAPAAARRT